MFQIDQIKFEEYINEAIASLPAEYVKHLKNVAFIVENRPSDQLRQKQGLRPGQTLLGLYEGVPLSQRQGTVKLLPDKITLYKEPIEYLAGSEQDIKEQIRHTIWHEVAHYFGLGHQRIAELDDSGS